MKGTKHGKGPKQGSTSTKVETGTVKGIPRTPGSSNVTMSALNDGGDTAFRGKGTWKK